MLGLHFTPACVLLSVCSLHFTLSMDFTPGLQSAVRSPQSAFCTDRNENIIYIVLKLAIHLPIENGGIKFKELFIFLHSFKVVFNRRETTVEPLVRLLTATSPQRPPVCNSHFFGKQSIHWLSFNPLQNGHFLLSPRRPLWRGSTVLM